MERTAYLSLDGVYRYRLGRVWDPELPVLGWIMLNPSKADALVDDPTIRRCISFARRWGFGGIDVANLFAYRATDPAELADAASPLGRENLRELLTMITDFESVGEVICAWGAWTGHPVIRRLVVGYVMGRAKAAGRELWCLGETKAGAPKHPLYLPGETIPVHFGRLPGDKVWPARPSTNS